MADVGALFGLNYFVKLYTFRPDINGKRFRVAPMTRRAVVHKQVIINRNSLTLCDTGGIDTHRLWAKVTCLRCLKLRRRKA